RVVGRGAVHPVPEGVARARARRADVGVAVVAVDFPRVEQPLQVHEIGVPPTQVVHDLLLPAFHERRADAPGDVVERLIPRDALPLAAAARPHAAQRIEDPLRIGHLVQRGGPLRAVAAPASRVERGPLALLDLEGRLVDVGQETAAGLAVEADRRDQRVAALDLLRPGDRVVLLPAVPALDGRIRSKPALGRAQLAGNGVQRLRQTIRHASLRMDVQLNGTDWPARTHRSSHSQSPASARAAARWLSGHSVRAKSAITNAIGRTVPASTTPHQKRVRYPPRVMSRASFATSRTGWRVPSSTARSPALTTSERTISAPSVS